MLKYFSNNIKDTELDSMPIMDATECMRMGVEKNQKDMIYQHQFRNAEMEGLSLEHKLAAWMITFAKYTNASAAIVMLCKDGKQYPVYQELTQTVTTKQLIDSIANWICDVNVLEPVAAAEIVKELELQPMPAITEDETMFMQMKSAEYPFVVLLCRDEVRIKYNQACYLEKSIDRIARAYMTVLKNVYKDVKIQEINMVDDAMLAELDSFLNNTVEYDTSLTITELLKRSMKKYANEIAVVYKDRKLTYKELDDVTNKVADYIIKKGIGKVSGKEQVVSILIGRSEFMPIAAIGVLKAGAAYQPLDPSYPMDRLQFMMEDANAQLLIADEALLHLVPAYKGDVLWTSEIADLPPAKAPEITASVNDLYILLYTSGSTGVPKGVMLEHRNLVAFIHFYCKYYNLDEHSRVAAYASFGFDANMMDTYPILAAGGQLHIIEEDIRLDLIQINQYFETNGITHSFMTTQVGRQYAQMFGDRPYPQYLSVGGETLVPIEPPTGYPFYNIYGPTETTVIITAFKVDQMYKNVPIGYALDNMKLYVLDSNLNRLPVGVPGELCVAGPQVSRGYLNREEQTKQVFVTNPYDSEYPYDRIYRTGDVVRFLSDGSIEFIGRRDSQVKIRGFRIELSEVEGIIRKFPDIKDATVVAYEEAGGGKYITAYIVSDQQIDIDKLNAFILETKPPYMVPAVTMQIDSIPLNQNQKVDKKALPKPVRQLAEIVMPQNEKQQKMFDCLKDILGYDDFGITTTFTEAGLTSIASIRLIVELTKLFNVPISITDLKEHDTIQSMETFIDSYQEEDDFEERDCYPLTQTQLGIYVECLRNPESVLYNLPGSFALKKDTDIEALKNAVHQVIDAHSAMKCVIHEDAQGMINMYPRKEEAFEIEVVEGSEAEWDSYFAHFARPFHMKDELLFRFAIYKTEAHVYLVLDFHHIVSDGSSIAVFAEELNRALIGEPLEGEAFSQYDVAVVEEKKRKQEVYQQAKAYYDSIFNGLMLAPGIEGDLKEQSEGCGFYKVYDERTDKKQVEAFCKKYGITENVFFTSVMGYVLGKYTNSEEAVFTTIYNGRKDSRTMNTFGMMVKTFPVYCYCPKEMQVKEYVMATQEQMMNSMSHDLYSFAEISRAYQLKPEIMFVYQGDAFVDFEIDGQTTVLREAVSDRAKANISINIFVENGQYRYEYEYMSHVYSEEFMARFYDIYVEAVNHFLTSDVMGEVTILSEKERLLMERFNDTDWEVEIQSVNRLFEAWVEKIPDQTAVIANGESLTYRQLNEKANQVANELLKRSSKPNTLVGLILDREKNVYITRQGILKADAGFLPLVPAYPDDRIDFCLRDAGCQFVITTKEIADSRPQLFDNKPYELLLIEDLLQSDQKDNPNLEIDPNHLAYCLYTSGSTGNPKGVLIEHKTLCNFVNSNPKNIETKNYVDNGKVSLAFAAITFDVSVMEEFIPLCNGMTICMATEEEIHNPLMLGELLLKNHVDIMKCTPSFMMSIIEIPQMREAVASIKAFDIGAETFPPALYDKMRAVNPTAPIINSYGPTECTVSATSKDMTSSENVTIGGPLANMKLYVVDSNLHILPVGIPGELIICGAGVGRGYMNLPDKTAQAFFTFNGLPAYHSGDLVRFTTDGEIDFQGRLDNQVKLRGLRVELDEVENAIGTYEGIKSCKVVVKHNGKEEFLAAYYTAGSEIDKDDLTAHLSAKLAYYMVPGALMQLEEMPLTNHGKIDKKRLPEIEYKSAESEYVAPENPLEEELCAKYAEVLSLERVGATDSFFEIGGTSLSAMMIILYCESKGYELVYKDIFNNPSPRQLAKSICGESETKQDKDHITTFDYSRIENILKRSTLTYPLAIDTKEIGNVLLTGATGYLGIHMLRELLKKENTTIYCMVRKGKYETALKRLLNLYMYYFGVAMSEEDKARVVCVDADITNNDLDTVFAGMEFDTVVNCAACVKHFVQDDLLDRINVKGVENLIALCLKRGAALVHVSTTSVGGEGNALTVPKEKLMLENELYFNQIVENDYVRTKLLGERAILTAVAEDGLKAQIMRVGNLMSRKEDGEFQINFITNGFMRSLRSYKQLGQFPMGSMHYKKEFSPIDSVAEAIATLMHCKNNFTVFHVYNNHQVCMADVIYAMKEHGFAIDIVDDETFAKTLEEAKKDETLSDAVLGLTAYDSADENPRYEIESDNAFTIEVLYRMHYKWPITDDAYMLKAVDALETLGFFD